ncbi:phage antirepressor KilAC domain-containing protein [Acinetobacter baumannii]|nr:Rha family transcriptional regulator [Acinetobacter baumannii]
MTQLVDTSILMMSSLEISELIQLEHRTVLLSIEYLAKLGIIQLPRIVKVESIQLFSLDKFTNVYEFTGEQGKRDSIIVVAQLCPELTMQLVDFWQELEHEIKNELGGDIFDSRALRRTLLDYTEQVMHLETQNQSLERTIDNITQTRAGVKFQQACKILNIKRDVLANWLHKHGWDRKLNKVRTSTYYSQKRGYCETKYEEVVRIRANGDQYSFTKIEFFILPKGMNILAKHFSKEA